jgi:ribosome biogenesis GTPase / thiamine phosphate phosphatase
VPGFYYFIEKLEETTLNYLKEIGFNEHFEKAAATYIQEGLEVGRVSVEYRGMYRLLTEHGEKLAEVSGKYRHQALAREDYPAVGDWVVYRKLPEDDKAVILHTLPRFSKFSRKTAGLETTEQILATNIDTVFLVNALNNDFNPRRIERYLLMAWESGANPVIILSKADLCDDLEDKINEVEQVAFGVPIIAVSSVMGDGLDLLSPYITTGKTVALLGSSGVGKSTLINVLFGDEVQLTKEVREQDDRGRHTTTHRELFILPSGGILIDTPGMREFQLWDTAGGLETNFQDIENFALECQFRDCSHENEPNCAVRLAIEDRRLTEGRYASYKKLQRELAYIERKNDQRAKIEERNKWKKLSKSVRSRK